MKAIVRDTYGSVGVLELRDVDSPEIGDGEVLLRVQAAGPDAIRYLTEGHARGKVVITIGLPASEGTPPPSR